MYAYILFIIVLFCISVLHRWIPIGISAISGAVAAIVLGLVEISDLKQLIVFIANPTATLIFIVIISLILEKVGFFDFFSLVLIRISKGCVWVMFLFIILLCALVASFFTNDGAILIMTPLILSKLSYISFSHATKMAFLMAVCFIADASSLTFTISNLTNILSMSNFPMTFNAYFSGMIWVNVVSVVVSCVMLFIVFRKELRVKIEIENVVSPFQVVKNAKLFYFSIVFLPLLFFTFFYLGSNDYPSSLILLPFTLIYLILALLCHLTRPREILHKTPFNVIFFSFGMYVLVLALKETSFFSFSADILSFAVKESTKFFLFLNGLYIALLSSVFNNLPAILASFLYEKGLDLNQQMKGLFTFSSIIGANIGAKLTPFGSLSTILWYGLLKKRGITVPMSYYIKKSFLLTVPTLLFVLIFFALTA